MILKWPKRGANKMFVLSIDDSKAVHAFIDRSLSATAYKILHALSAKEGLELLHNKKNEIAVILLDWEMPDKNGPELLAEIRKAGIALPVIMLTSKSDTSDIVKMLELGATEYVMKPFTPDILIEKIQNVLGQASV